jgi:general L-amino acid transport system permease protein
VTDTVLTETLAVPPPEPPRPPTAGPGDWVRRNLFRSPVDGAVTIVAGAVVGYVLYRLLRYVFVTGRWDIVRVNLKLFMVGRYPDDQLWRITVALAVLACFGGVVGGFAAQRRRATGRETVEAVPWWRSVFSAIGRLWPLVLGVVVLLLLAGTVGPWLVAAAVVAAAIVGRLLGPLLPLRSARWLVLAAIVLGVGLVWFLTRAVGWDEWGGLMLNLFLAAAAITLCFPIGVLLALGRAAGRKAGSRFNAVLSAVVLGALPIVLFVAMTSTVTIASFGTLIVVVLAVLLAYAGWRLGQRSSLPLLRAVSIGYIELFRGVPLFVLLLLSYLALGFFIPTWMTAPGLVVRAIVALTLFTAAYVAEIVRGGLQSLPLGQMEAAEALGMRPIGITGLIVLPQALRNVIPGLVGQFISLFKDTTLAAAAMTFLDALEVGRNVTSQGEFRGQLLAAETLSFVMFLFWVGCITMSRESQRLERRLGVGVR